MATENFYLNLNEEILQYLLKYREQHPSFTFGTRVKNLKNRLNEGLWFLGDGNYLFVGFYKIGDARNKTKSIGFCLSIKNNEIRSNYIEIVFPIDESQELINAHVQIKMQIEALNQFAIKEDEKDRKYIFNFKTNDWQNNLDYFLNTIRPIIEENVDRFELQQDFYISEANFLKSTNRIQKIKEDWLKPKPPQQNELIFTNSEESTYPLNTIIYGPPGTGKTYKTVELAYQIAFNFDNTEEVSHSQAQKWFSDELKKEDDRQIDFVTFHQNYSYEDFVMGIKPSLNGEQMSFRNHKGIFYKICQRAKQNLEQSSEKGGEIIPEFQTVFDEMLNPITVDGIDIPIKMQRDNYVFNITGLNEKNLNFKKPKGDSQHTLSIQTIKDLFDGNREFNIQGLGSYYYPLVEELKNIQKALTKKIAKVELKNFVLIIDEINRANISLVFGELITLIEEDKRWGAEFPAEVRLPDGKTVFSVPNNLYIIGTMNTADKSIALLDIALRRRFDFEPLYPDSTLVLPEYKEFFQVLNKLIVEQKGNEFAIGHSFFMKQRHKEFDFQNVMNKKVIPLLNEYFYSGRNSEAIKTILDSALSVANLKYEIISNGFQYVINHKV